MNEIPKKLRRTFDLLQKGPISRREAATELGLGQETARSYIVKLIREGMACECGTRRSDADRQIKLYGAVPGAEWPTVERTVAIAIDYAEIDMCMRSMVAHGKEMRV